VAGSGLTRDRCPPSDGVVIDPSADPRSVGGRTEVFGRRD
jgi:hypothetical protein